MSACCTSASSQEGTSPLHFASAEGHVEVVRLLLKWMKHRARLHVNDGNADRDTALHWACSEGHMRVARELLDAGADPNIGNKDMNTRHDTKDAN